MTKIYPDNDKALYYVEFHRGGKTNEFTLFQRYWFYSKEDLEQMKKQTPEDFPMLEMCNEGHPWNILTATYGPLGCMPDEKWIEFMVDALNREASRIKAKAEYDAAISKSAELLAKDIDKEILDKILQTELPNHPQNKEKSA